MYHDIAQQQHIHSKLRYYYFSSIPIYKLLTSIGKSSYVCQILEYINAFSVAKNAQKTCPKLEKVTKILSRLDDFCINGQCPEFSVLSVHGYLLAAATSHRISVWLLPSSVSMYNVCPNTGLSQDTRVVCPAARHPLWVAHTVPSLL